MSTARVVCSNDRYPGGRVEVEDDDGRRWTGSPVRDVVAASYQPRSET